MEELDQKGDCKQGDEEPGQADWFSGGQIWRQSVGRKEASHPHRP